MIAGSGWSLASPDKIKEFLGRRRRYWFEVHPRFEAGPPIVASIETARKAAKLEVVLYADLLIELSDTCPCKHEFCIQRAKTLRERVAEGVHGIVECWVKPDRTWRILDLCTSEERESKGPLHELVSSVRNLGLYNR